MSVARVMEELYLAKGSLHGQLGGIACIDAGAEGLYEALKHLSAQITPHVLLHRLLLLCAEYNTQVEQCKLRDPMDQ